MYNCFNSRDASKALVCDFSEAAAAARALGPAQHPLPNDYADLKAISPTHLAH